ncbi:Nonribosomal peptide synthetase dtxS1 [Beauveria bassiana]|uniref:Nonribosomal peptide synthetase dtxS1 n=1 Tax=Beauveria bassiana TaxID=176275 RepID=A0A2N6NVL8_BEABA|nr:Nonribosomal peptide synthetase dtxS1 [Beauveria bassiana]
MAMAMHDTGTPLSRCGLVEEDEHGDNYFIWALHPAIHDDISLRQHLREIDQTYSGLERASSLPFQLYVRFCETLDERRAAMFWERKLSGAKAAPFPNVAAGAAAQVRPDKSLQQYITGPLELGKDDSAASATVWMAWAMLTARYTDSEEVLFGARVTGRQAAMEDIDRIAGPTTSTVPIWASIDWQSTISEVRQQMQRQAANLVPFAQLGLKKIRQLSAEADKASRFQSLIVFQSAQDVERYSSVVFASEFEDMGTAGSFPRDNYAVVITCRTLGQKVRCNMEFDSSIVHEKEAQRMLGQFCHILQLVCSPSNNITRLSDLDMASPRDLQDIWSKNAVVPAAVNNCVHTIIAENTARQRHAPAVCGWDGELTYAELDELSTQLAYHLIDIGVKSRDHIARQRAGASGLPQVSPSQTLFITYTSGSTGTPKGARMSHSNVCAAIHYQGYVLGFRTTSRVLDFSPYSFDVAWSNVLHTLCAGGCLCVASMDEMMDSIDDTLLRYRVNLVNITPSTLRAITPEHSALETILLSGERPNSHVLSQWIDKVCIKNTYGPSECTFKSAHAIVSPANLQSPDIGQTFGVCGWVVQPGRDDLLAPFGQVGELLIEGPLVGQGYLNEVEKTSASFIHDPPWLLRGGPGVVGRHGRLYKTGDLVRHNVDGTMQFVGRRDEQVKIRGQRVELGEVEYHVQKHLATTSATTLPFAVELITPRGSQNAMLVVFISVPRTKSDRSMETVTEELTLGLNDKLAQVLPRSMIPSSYVPITELPMGGTGKIDRRRLRQIGSELSREELLATAI